MQPNEDRDIARGEPLWVFSGARHRVLLLIFALVFAICVVLGLFLRGSGVPDGMAPGATSAVRRALGDVGVARIVQVISPGNRPSKESAGTHLASGVFRGKPYGLAFDIAILNPSAADADVRSLRLQGIAAWRRGPGAPGGAPGLLPHIHCVWPGAPTRNFQNREQVSSFVHGYRGVVPVEADRSTWRDPSIQSDEQAQVKGIYERVNGGGSLVGVPVYEVMHHR